MEMFIFFKAFQLRQVLAHSRKRNPFAISAIIPHRQRNKVIPNNATDIQIVMQTFQRFIMKKFMFRVSHWCIKYQVFNPFLVGRQTRNLAITLEMSANLIL